MYLSSTLEQVHLYNITFKTDTIMDKGQHLRLFIEKLPYFDVQPMTNDKQETTGKPQVIAFATDMSFHVSAQTEDSTSKDSTDNNNLWQENEVTGISYDIQIGAMIGFEEKTGEESANKLEDFIDNVSDKLVNWSLYVVEGEKNRKPKELIASGRGKLSNVSPTGTNRQAATYTATLTGYGPYEVPE